MRIPFTDKSANIEGATRNDFAIAGAVMLAAVVLAPSLDLFEFWFHLSRSKEEWELDEIFLVVFIGALTATWFAYLRWQALRKEVRRRECAENERIVLKRQLHQAQN